MMRRRSQNNRFSGITATLLMQISALLLLLSYSSMVANPAKAWFMSVFGLMYVPLVLLNVFFLLYSACRLSRSFLIPLLALLPSVIFIGRYYQFSSGAAEGNDGKAKIVTYNVGHFLLGRGRGLKDSGACLDSVVDFIGKTDADIVCLQEVNLPGEYDVAPFFKKHFPGYNATYYMYVTDKGSYGNVTLGRYPVKGKGHFDFERSSNLAIYSDYLVNGSTLRVYNCHFESYNISISHLVKSLGRDSTIVHSTEQKMKKSIRRRPQQVDLVMSDIEKCPVPSIVAGDFNDNPMSYTYYRLTKGRKDTFVEAGKGFGSTYSIFWPSIRIDYILFPKQFSAVSYSVPHKKYSDHYPVISEINLK